MDESSNELPAAVAIARFVTGTVALCVLSALATLMLWAVGYPVVRGWSPTVITSGSMTPSIEVGDVLVAGPVDADRLVPGSVIVFDNPAGSGFVSHRLVEVLPTGEYRTWGDANESADSTPVRPDQVRGIGRLVVPLVGRPYAWAAAGDTDSLLLGALALVGLVIAARWGYRPEFDPWATPQEPRPRVDGSRVAPAIAAGAAIMFFGSSFVGTRPVHSAFTDPAQSDASITAAGTFP
ncbi:MAG: signal peptidase I [Acidimicrobiales bacterium]